ncbi:hypothetical protein BI308_25505 [Roseofilum reptotaenium AO1-A]|uniref:Uncharacterized protein n=1 Tax=Roseofilum reptotaenium AO1-A TaxID=1925591 RepID=A0A1L9QJC8_9CYAN|nr:hypothetical protein BI308_25505 [Roseofilum reptotaenium AO1-A]
MEIHQISDRLTAVLLEFGDISNILGSIEIYGSSFKIQTDHQWRVEMGSPFLQIDRIQEDKIVQTWKTWSSGLAIGEIWIDAKLSPDGWDLDLIRHEFGPASPESKELSGILLQRFNGMHVTDFEGAINADSPVLTLERKIQELGRKQLKIIVRCFHILHGCHVHPNFEKWLRIRNNGQYPKSHEQLVRILQYELQAKEVFFSLWAMPFLEPIPVEWEGANNFMYVCPLIPDSVSYALVNDFCREFGLPTAEKSKTRQIQVLQRHLNTALQFSVHAKS